MPKLVSDPNYVYEHSPFFAEQLTSFEVWLEHSPSPHSPPMQLPIVLQMLLSQTHRLRALRLLGRFLDVGPWAVNLALSLHAPNQALRATLVPAARDVPIDRLLAALDDHLARAKRRTVTTKGAMVEYILLSGVNDRPEHADRVGGRRGHTVGGDQQDGVTGRGRRKGVDPRRPRCQPHAVRAVRCCGGRRAFRRSSAGTRCPSLPLLPPTQY